MQSTLRRGNSDLKDFKNKRLWEPVSVNNGWTHLGRLLSFPSYPFLLPYTMSHCEATVDNARWWTKAFAGIGLSLSTLCHGLVWHRWGRSNPYSVAHVAGQCYIALAVGYSHFWMAVSAWHISKILQVDRTAGRLNLGRLHGPRVLIMGNGPSAVDGPQMGHEIDKFDEVVRFNNFQTKAGSMSKWVGSKTTVHFGDGLLSATFTEYHAPGATIVLSLFADTFMVAGTYFAFRYVIDMQRKLTKQFYDDPELTWITKESIERLKKELDSSPGKHPTSGMLAIDYFVNKPGVQLPVVIHGFDFFMGPTVHYYAKHEPWYERINNVIGVNMHQPWKEKIYVEKLVQEGKVQFLKDMKDTSSCNATAKVPICQSHGEFRFRGSPC